MINKNQYDDDKYAYDIILQRHLNDSRHIRERSTIYLASSSILFLAFVNLPDDVNWLRIIIACLGIIWSVLDILAIRRTSLGLEYWENKERMIENFGPSFEYMREHKMEPHRMHDSLKGKWFARLRVRTIYSFILPSLFIFLWISALYWVC